MDTHVSPRGSGVTLAGVHPERRARWAVPARRRSPRGSSLFHSSDKVASRHPRSFSGTTFALKNSVVRQHEPRTPRESPPPEVARGGRFAAAGGGLDGASASEQAPARAFRWGAPVCRVRCAPVGDPLFLADFQRFGRSGTLERLGRCRARSGRARPFRPSAARLARPRRASRGCDAVGRDRGGRRPSRRRLRLGFVVVDAPRSRRDPGSSPPSPRLTAARTRPTRRRRRRSPTRGREWRAPQDALSTDRPVFATFVSNGFHEFALNWYGHVAERVRVDNVIVAALDDETEKLCPPEASRSTRTPICGTRSR